jgi:hypothetical protein
MHLSVVSMEEGKGPNSKNYLDISSQIFDDAKISILQVFVF